MPRRTKGGESNRGNMIPERAALPGASDEVAAVPSERYAITVSFSLRHEARAKFIALVRSNARTSIECEPGCRRFDVLTPWGTTGDVLLYEIYDDRRAFEAHLASEHFLAFDAATRAIVTNKVVAEFKVFENAKV
jgi:(4S)-4-hydroxy-5-phosphonooxypentane-2,3-dione isomerase